MPHHKPTDIEIEPRKSHKGRYVSAIVLIAVIMFGSLITYFYYHPTPTSRPPQPSDFYDRLGKACLVRNMTTLTSLYRVYINVTNRLNWPVTFVDVSVAMNSTTFSNGMGYSPLDPTAPLHIPFSWWVLHGANLTFYIYLPVNGSLFHYPHALVTGALLTVYVSIEGGQVGIEHFPVYPELYVSSLTTVPVCTDVKSG